MEYYAGFETTPKKKRAKKIKREYMYIDKEKEKVILSEFFIALCEAETKMANQINQLINETDPLEASVCDATAQIVNKFSVFISDFEDILRDKLNIDTLEFFKDEEVK